MMVGPGARGRVEGRVRRPLGWEMWEPGRSSEHAEGRERGVARDRGNSEHVSECK